MSSQRHEPDLFREWLDETYEAERQPDRFLELIIEAAPIMPQRQRRWWHRLPSRQIETPSASDTLDYQPSPIPATDGHTPTVIGRTQTMLSPVKAIAAGAIVFALSGVLLIAQPFQQSDSVPGAEADSPTWVTGTGFWAPSCSGPTSTEDDGDVTRERGYVCEPTRWETSDPRLTGDASWRWNADVYTTDEGQRTVVHGAEYLRNEGGGWTCPILRLANRSGNNPDQYNISDTQLCVGDGGYEGLSALIVWPGENSTSSSLLGLIFSGDVPPLPDPPAVE